MCFPGSFCQISTYWFNNHCLFFHSSYNGKESDTLGKLRHVRFLEMSAVATKTIEPQSLPPTERAAYFHSLRVHLQVAQWKTLCLSVLVPTDWGWKVEKGALVPITTDKEAGPQNLLNFIRCKCKLTSKNTCGTNICSCRKNGLCVLCPCVWWLQGWKLQQRWSYWLRRWCRWDRWLSRRWKHIWTSSGLLTILFRS